MSGFHILHCSKSTINRKNVDDIIVCWHNIIVNFFWWSCVSLIKFSCWSKFLVNVIIGFGVMTIFLYKGFDQKSGNWKYPPSEVCTITGDCGKLEIPNLAWMFLMKIYLLLQNVRFTICIVYKWKQQGFKKSHPD